MLKHSMLSSICETSHIVCLVRTTTLKFRWEFMVCKILSKDWDSSSVPEEGIFRFVPLDSWPGFHWILSLGFSSIPEFANDNREGMEVDVLWP